MKDLFRLIIIFSLFILVACGQQAEPQVNQITEIATSSTSMETKELITVSSTDKKQDDTNETETAEEEEEEEEEEDNNDDNTEETAVTDSSQDNQEETDNNTTNESRMSSSSNSDASSSNSNKREESIDNSSANSSNQATISNKSTSKGNTTSSDNKQSDTSKQTTKSKQSSKPKAKENSPTPTEKSTVTVSIETPIDLKGPNLAPTQVEIADGDTAFAATLKVLNSKGISVDYTGSGATAYVKSIGGIGEFDAGPLSGWNIYVEGILIPRSADAYEVFNGYKVHWKYTKNYLEI